jgi:hypothetical protein
MDKLIGLEFHMKTYSSTLEKLKGATTTTKKQTQKAGKKIRMKIFTHKNYVFW